MLHRTSDLEGFLRRILSRKELKKAENEKLHNLYTSPDIIRMIKSG
jgi:hypothetical protein